ncbi:putative 6-phosphogluconolactonase [Grifola frondosa]|uniref:6-phosphogluconolactonase n=1 Tax=Grifola frondosa TaxID=5627 RepID=A0A1C7MQC4_GRIFR|nr:putative 6-phosphogluconolactonase [Grifola frondosa]
MPHAHAPPAPPVLFSFPSSAQLTDALAQFIIKSQKESIEKKGRFTVAISGGSLPKLLTALIDRPGLKWDKWQVFYADERVVPLDHPDSNHALATRELFSKVPIPASHIHTIDPALADDLEELSDAYEKELIREFAMKDSARFPIFDLILLGVGPDGHTASLFPAHELLSEEDRWVAYIEDSPKPPPKRVTFTFPVLNHAIRVAFVAAGASKADILPTVLDQPEAGLPASRVRPVSPGALYWFVDDAASAKVQYSKTPFKL